MSPELAKVVAAAIRYADCQRAVEHAQDRGGFAYSITAAAFSDGERLKKAAADLDAAVAACGGTDR